MRGWLDQRHAGSPKEIHERLEPERRGPLFLVWPSVGFSSPSAAWRHLFQIFMDHPRVRGATG